MKRVLFYAWAIAITVGVAFASLPMVGVLVMSHAPSQQQQQMEMQQMAETAHRLASPVLVQSIVIWDSRDHSADQALSTFAQFAGEYGNLAHFDQVDIAKDPGYAAKLSQAVGGAFSAEDLAKAGAPVIVTIESSRQDGSVIVRSITHVKDGDFDLSAIESLLKSVYSMGNA